MSSVVLILFILRLLQIFPAPSFLLRHPAVVPDSAWNDGTAHRQLLPQGTVSVLKNWHYACSWPWDGAVCCQRPSSIHYLYGPLKATGTRK